MALSNLKPWQIAAIGTVVVAAGLVAVNIIAGIGYDLTPVTAWGPVIISHLAGLMAALYFFGRPFAEAFIIASLRQDDVFHGRRRAEGEK